MSAKVCGEFLLTEILPSSKGTDTPLNNLRSLVVKRTDGSAANGYGCIIQMQTRHAINFSFGFPFCNSVTVNIFVYYGDGDDHAHSDGGNVDVPAPRRHRELTRRDSIVFSDLVDAFPVFAEETRFETRIRFELFCSTPNRRSRDELASKATSTLLTDFSKLLETGADADVVVAVDGQEIPAHRCVLKARSAYFAKMFASGMSEDRGGRVEVVGVDADAFLGVLRFIYAGAVDSEVERLAPSMLPKVDEMGLTDLKVVCVETMKGAVTTDNVCRFLRLSHLHGCEDLKADCLAFVKRNAKSVLRTEGWKDIAHFPEIFTDIVSCMAD